MAGLLDIDMGTPEGQGFNSALMQAAAMLLTPRHRGGGVGSAFAAMPQAIDRAKQQAMRERMFGLQEQQLGMQGQRLGFEMDEAQRKAAQERDLKARQADFWRRWGGQSSVSPQMVAEGQQIGIQPDVLKSLAESPNWGRTQLAFQNGVGVDPYTGEPKAAVPNVNQPFSPQIGPDGRVTAQANTPFQSFKLADSSASAPSVQNFIMPATPGQEAADKKFAGDFIDFATGGYADVVKQLDQLREASNTLGSGASISGPFMGNLPDAVLAATNPQAVSTKEMIQEVAQRNLRVILGAQFTEKEGERLIARVFNPRLGEAENKKRVDRLIRQIGDAAKAKLDASQYFQQHGSLTGWQGRLPRLSDFDPDFRKKGADDRPPADDDPLGLRGR